MIASIISILFQDSPRKPLDLVGESDQLLFLWSQIFSQFEQECLKVLVSFGNSFQWLVSNCLCSAAMCSRMFWANPGGALPPYMVPAWVLGFVSVHKSDLSTARIWICQRRQPQDLSWVANRICYRCYIWICSQLGFGFVPCQRGTDTGVTCFKQGVN